MILLKYFNIQKLQYAELKNEQLGSFGNGADLAISNSWQCESLCWNSESAIFKCKCAGRIFSSALLSKIESPLHFELI